MYQWNFRDSNPMRQNRRERGIEIRRKTDAGNSEKSRIRSVSGNEGSTGGQSAAAGEAGAEGAKVGDELEVFLYRDSSDRLISTTRTPKLCMGQVALLTVVQVGKVGAFLDWGLEKDLLLPFKQQTRKVKTGEQVLAALYIDKSGRLCATMNVYEHLRTDSPYKKDDKVTGRIYEISKNFGAFVAVDNCFSGLIPKKELFGDTELRIGDQVTARSGKSVGRR